MVCPSPDRCHTFYFPPPALLWALSALWAHQRGAMFPKKLAQGHAACGACVCRELAKILSETKVSNGSTEGGGARLRAL